jgi:glycosyltransferase involved in cell wall biosynthesis
MQNLSDSTISVVTRLGRRIGGFVNPEISIVIPAHDEEGYLGATLEALDAQTYRNFETIVVANGCSDRTAEIAAGSARVIELGVADMTVARNVGARAAAGEILVFLDADVLLPPRTLERLANELTVGWSIATFPARPSGRMLWYRPLFALRNLVFRTGIYRSTWGVLACPRDLFSRVGGFDPSRFPQEHRDLVRRLLRSGRYQVLPEKVIVSTRRFERWGPVRLTRYWLSTYLRSFAGRFPDDDYDVVR